MFICDRFLKSIPPTYYYRFQPHPQEMGSPEAAAALRLHPAILCVPASLLRRSWPPLVAAFGLERAAALAAAAPVILPTAPTAPDRGF